MVISQVITLFLPDFVGGATLACAQVAEGLRARGHDVAVFCGRPHGDAPPYEESSWEVGGLPVFAVNAAPGYAALDARSYRHPETAPAFARFLERTRPDVVHFHSIQALGANLLEVAAAARIPIVVTMHDWWWWCARLFLVDQHDFVCPPRVASERCHCAPGFDLVARRRYLATTLRLADRVLTPSRFLADAAIANGVEPARVTVSANGVTRVGATPRPPGPVRFGYFGGPDHRLKGLATLLAAADRARCGGFELVLHVDDAATRLGWPHAFHDRVGQTVAIPVTIADRVRVRGAFAPAALAAALAGLDCLVVPSLMRESYSLVTREALAAGVPVIASDSGGPAEAIRPERNGLLFATGDPDDLAACLRRFVLEPGLADRLRSGAGATEVPTHEGQIADLERVYAEVRGRRPRSERSAGGDATVPAALGAVLFVAGCDGAPFRHRVTHLRDALATRGIASRALWYTDPEVPAAIAAAEIVVVYRVPMSPWLAACIDHARSLGRAVVFSCDDLVFDAASTPRDALAALTEAERAWWLQATERYAATLRASDAFLGSTEPLAAAAERLGIPAFTARNGIGRGGLAVAERVRKSPSGPRDGVVLAYGSGTTMHDLDFAVVAPALARVLAARPTVRLVLAGHLLSPPALEPWRARIRRLPFLPWHELLAALATVDVQLAPLRLHDPFSDAKSEVKYLEAGALGVPTIASPTAAFRRAITPGVNGFLAASSAEWEARLLELVDDAGLRRRLGNQALADVFLRATPEARAEELVTALGRAREAAARRGKLSAPRAAVAPPLAESFPHETGRYDLEPEDLVAGTAVEAADTPSGFLGAGRTVGQRFVAGAGHLTRIDVRVGTDGRPHRDRLTVHVAAAPDAGDLRCVVLDAAEIADGAWCAALFEAIPESAGRSFYVWVESDRATAEDGVTLWTYVRGHGDAPPPGLHLDHRPAAGSLTFRTFHVAERTAARS